jgi:hypothetical protein
MAGADGQRRRCFRSALKDRRPHRVMGDTHIELSALVFGETSDSYALIEAPGEIGGARRLIVPGLPGILGTTLKAAPWNSLPRLLLGDRRSANV